MAFSFVNRVTLNFSLHLLIGILINSFIDTILINGSRNGNDSIKYFPQALVYLLLPCSVFLVSLTMQELQAVISSFHFEGQTKISKRQSIVQLNTVRCNDFKGTELLYVELSRPLCSFSSSLSILLWTLKSVLFPQPLRSDCPRFSSLNNYLVLMEGKLCLDVTFYLLKIVKFNLTSSLILYTIPRFFFFCLSFLVTISSHLLEQFSRFY